MSASRHRRWGIATLRPPTRARRWSWSALGPRCSRAGRDRARLGGSARQLHRRPTARSSPSTSPIGAVRSCAGAASAGARATPCCTPRLHHRGRRARRAGGRLPARRRRVPPRRPVPDAEPGGLRPRRRRRRGTGPTGSRPRARHWAYSPLGVMGDDRSRARSSSGSSAPRTWPGPAARPCPRSAPRRCGPTRRGAARHDHDPDRQAHIERRDDDPDGDRDADGHHGADDQHASGGDAASPTATATSTATTTTTSGGTADPRDARTTSTRSHRQADGPAAHHHAPTSTTTPPRSPRPTAPPRRARPHGPAAPGSSPPGRRPGARPRARQPR